MTDRREHLGTLTLTADEDDDTVEPHWEGILSGSMDGDVFDPGQPLVLAPFAFPIGTTVTATCPEGADEKHILSENCKPPGRSEKPLDHVRELGFDKVLGGAQPEETVFFLGPQKITAGRAESNRATEEAIVEFIFYWENQVTVARDYLANGLRTNKMHEWKWRTRT